MSLKRLKLSSLMLLTALGISGCHKGTASMTTLNVNTEFAKTSYGYVNSGGYRSGSLFIWDRRAKSLVFIDNVAGFDPGNAGPAGTDTTISYDSGLTTDASLSTVVKARLEATIRSDATITIKDARRIPTSHYITKLTDYMKANPDAFAEWHFRDVAAGRDKFYLLVRDITYGDALDLEINGERSASGGFPIKIAEVSFQVKFTGKGLGSLKGQDIPLVMNFTVLKPDFIPNSEGGQNPTFRPVLDSNPSGLPELLRGAGTAS